MDPKFISLFPYVLQEFKVDGFNENEDELIKFAYQEKEKHTKSLKRSNEGGWHSPEDYAYNDNILSNIVYRNLTNHFSNTEVYVPNMKPLILNMWMIINGQGDYNQKHIHPGSWMSGVFWLKAPDNCGDIYFDNPNIYANFSALNIFNDESKERCALWPSYSWKPMAGTMLLFPANLYHHVGENKSSSDRIACSFNFVYQDVIHEKNAMQEWFK